MAKKFIVELTRTTVERAEVTIEAANLKDASYQAAQATPEWAKIQALTRVTMVKPE